MDEPRCPIRFALVITLLLPTPALGSTNFVFKADATIKESFDSNVYLQDVAPDLTAVPKAAPPHQKSFVTSVTPRVGLDYRPDPAFAASLAYAPEVTFYHSAHSEDYVAHRGAVGFTGKIDSVVWEQANSVTWIDGSNEGLYFGGPGGAPAIGGIPIRDRRDAFIYRGGLRLTYTANRWFVRPVGSAYVHNFYTKQFNTALPQFKGYENYVDRNDVNGGLDAGYDIGDQTRVFAGYRYGYQNEGTVITEPFQYDNRYHRVLFGVEGQPAKWLKLGIALGPEFHYSTALVRTNFAPNYNILYVDSTATILPTTNDTIVLMLRQFTQPAFASCSVYEDTTYDLTWRHRFNERFSGTAGFRAYEGDWRPPTRRDDWIYTIGGGLSCALNRKLSVEAVYTYDWAVSRIPDTSGRGFTRHIGSLAVRYTF